MKTTIELPDDLIKEVKLLAVDEGRKLKDVVADLLRQALGGASRGPTVVKAGKAMLKRRKALTQKFVTGQWGLNLAGFESAREADRRSAAKRAKAWRN
jgi:plasmid stability protein